MPKYLVSVTRDVTETATLEVEAMSIRAAEAEALRRARANQGDLDWELDEGNTTTPYIPDPGNSARQIMEDVDEAK